MICTEVQCLSLDQAGPLAAIDLKCFCPPYLPTWSEIAQDHFDVKPSGTSGSAVSPELLHFFSCSLCNLMCAHIHSCNLLFPSGNLFHPFFSQSSLINLRSLWPSALCHSFLAYTFSCRFSYTAIFRQPCLDLSSQSILRHRTQLCSLHQWSKSRRHLHHHHLPNFQHLKSNQPHTAALNAGTDGP